MKIYIVQSSSDSPLPAKDLSREQRISIYQEELRQFRSLVDDFSKNHPTKINILGEAWIDCSLKIEAEDDVVEELKKIPGLTVREPVPLIRHPEPF